MQKISVQENRRVLQNWKQMPTYYDLLWLMTALSITTGHKHTSQVNVQPTWLAVRRSGSVVRRMNEITLSVEPG